MTRLLPRGRTGLAVVAGAALLVLSAVAATSSFAGTDRTGFTRLPANDPARGLVYSGLRVAKSGHCKGMLEVTAVPGACTHGPDMTFPGLDVSKPVAPQFTAHSNVAKTLASNIVCDGDGTTGYRVEVL